MYCQVAIITSTRVVNTGLIQHCVCCQRNRRLIWKIRVGVWVCFLDSDIRLAIRQRINSNLVWQVTISMQTKPASRVGNRRHRDVVWCRRIERLSRCEGVTNSKRKRVVCILPSIHGRQERAILVDRSVVLLNSGVVGIAHHCDALTDR